MISIRFPYNKHNPNFINKIETWFLSLTSSRVRVLFTENSKYELPKKEQADWNKLIGRKAFFRTNGSWSPANWEFGRFEQFWVWRYYEDEIQVAKYFRENNHFFWQRIWPAKVGFWKTLDTSWFTLWLPSGSYFGGSEPAPTGDVSYHIDRVKDGF